ncbi:MAG: protein-disulfide isomerase [Pseudohongiellaceae bacterium]|jgi:protein-disulfide isomerase
MSKRDQQRQKKEAMQQAAAQREQSKKLFSKVALFGIVPVLAVLVLYTLFTQGPTYSTVEIAENDHVRGRESNPVTIVVYADFQCPACATENETMTRLWPSIRDKAHLIFRHFPITAAHPHTWTASLFAEAAGKQGKFWEMHDYLFATQSIWASLPSFAAEQEFESYALELNLDIDQMKVDMESDELIRKVRNDQRSGNNSGVLSTPALFINGKLLARPSRDRIIEAVEAAYSDSAD